MSNNEIDDNYVVISSILNNNKVLLNYLEREQYDKISDKLIKSSLNDLYLYKEYNYDINEVISEYEFSLQIINEYNSKYNILDNFYKCIIRVNKNIEKLDYAVRHDDLIIKYENTLNDLINNIATDKNNYQSAKILESNKLKENNILFTVNSVLNGQLLEKYYLREIVEKMGYERKPGIINSNGGEIEIDMHGVKEAIKGIWPSSKITKKDVIIGESKNKIQKSDITKFAKKAKIVQEKYDSDAKLWGYKINIISWIVACYGWDKDLKDYAIEKGLQPIDSEKLVKIMKELNIYDSRNPPCP